MSTPRRQPVRIEAIRLLFRTLGAALLVVLGATQVLPSLHYALERHEICAEHGELRHQAEGVHSADAADSDTHGLSFFASGTDETEDHEHCGIKATSEQRAFLNSANAETADAPSVSAPQLVRASERAHVSVAVLSYAPKLAPPA